MATCISTHFSSKTNGFVKVIETRERRKYTGSKRSLSFFDVPSLPSPSRHLAGIFFKGI